MAKAKLRCNHCGDHLAHHCPDTNLVCVWFVCRNASCTADVYDLHRGLLRHTDGTVESWADADERAEGEPVVVEVVDEDGDGRAATPDA